MDVGALLERAAARHPQHPALAFGDRSWTFASWHERVRRVARSLADLGLQGGDRVAILLHTSELTASTYVACQLIGAVAVPLNYRLAPGEIAYTLEDAGASALVYGRTLEDRVAAARPRSPSVRHWLADSDLEAHLERVCDDAPRVTDDDPRRPSALLYTSGTTGRPKGVIHTHANDLAIAMNCAIEYGLRDTDVALHVAPLYHVGGMQAWFLPHLMVGGTNVILDGYTAERTLETIARERVTTLYAVPTQIIEMLTHPRLRSVDVSSLRMITTGGAPIAPETMQRVVDELSPGIFNGYGMTEASLTLLLHPADAMRKLGSTGTPTVISDCRLDPATGELLVRGPQVTPGYWNRPEETRGKLQDGWLRTGDVFLRDEDGFFWFRGRADDMIVSGGENIYPREVEDVLQACPGVGAVAVAGLADARWGQAVTAFVVRSDPELTAGRVDAFCRASEELTAFKRPKRVVFVDALPTNPSGKVLRRELVATYGDP